jgi:aminoglycoside 6-adenylyltransferase
MRDKNNVLQDVIKFAENNKNIEALLITSSMANPKAETDIFSDLDVVIVTDTPKIFINNKDWRNQFGEIMVSFNDNFKLEGITSYTSLVLYKDYIRIDFSIWPTELLKKIAEYNKLPAFLDIGYEVLYDKNNLSTDLNKASIQAYQTKKPTKSEYERVVNNFWWDITYIAKYLWRDQFYFAKYMDYFIKYNLLKPMVEWLIGVENNWEVNPGKQGSNFKKHLDDKLWQELMATFSGSDFQENWDSTFKMMDFFSKTSKKVAYRLRFEYPKNVEDDVREYIEKIYNKEIPFDK